jgi:hypothetical protein
MSRPFFIFGIIFSVMVHMRLLAAGLIFLFSSAFLYSDADLVHRLIVLPESKLSIDGKTNVNSFTCAIAKYAGTDTLVLREGGRNVRPVFVKGSVGLDASTFDCGMAIMTSDFRKTINSDKYPAIVIDFISFERTPTYKQGEEKFLGILKISLAGVTRLFEVNCTIETKSTGQIHLKGGRQFTFADFGLTPPTRMMGTIKVQEDLHVKFHLVLKLDPNS